MYIERVDRDDDDDESKNRNLLRNKKKVLKQGNVSLQPKLVNMSFQ